MEEDFEEKIAKIMKAMEAAGYDPYTQLAEFIRTGDQRYITRNENARRQIVELDRMKLRQYAAKLNL